MTQNMESQVEPSTMYNNSEGLVCVVDLGITIRLFQACPYFHL